MENTRQALELADIFRQYGQDFVEGTKLCPEQKKAFLALQSCRTAALGGHLERCDHCGHSRQSYNSCRNRHCPKCQFVKQAQWVDKLAGNLPPVRHFHVVFTIPCCLHHLFYLNQTVSYSLLFKAAGKTLMQCAQKLDGLGGQAGAVGILHTWGQTLVYHPHIHMIVPAGVLSEDGMEWIASGKKFFLPVKVLSQVFRGILCKLLEDAVKNDTLCLPVGISDFKQIKNQCYKKKWVVYCERPFSRADNLLHYLGNYTHRVAISNHRLLSSQGGKISFYYKDYKSGGIKREISLDAKEFIRRFLQHILPKGFCKIRYFGFMAMCQMKEKLSLCYQLIKSASYLPVLEGLSTLEVFRQISGKDPLICPVCKIGRMHPLETLSIEANCHSA